MSLSPQDESRIAAFEEALRRRTRSAFEEVERDFAALLARLSSAESALAGNTPGAPPGGRIADAAVSAFGGAFGADAGASLAASVLGAGLEAAARPGKTGRRRIVKAGADAAGQFLASQIGGAQREPGLRLSRNQWAADALSALQKGGDG